MVPTSLPSIFEETPILNDMKTMEIEGEIVAWDRGDYPHFALAMAPLLKERQALADDDVKRLQSVVASIRMHLNEGE